MDLLKSNGADFGIRFQKKHKALSIIAVDADNEPMGYIIENEIIKKTLIDLIKTHQTSANIRSICKWLLGGHATIQLESSTTTCEWQPPVADDKYSSNFVWLKND